MHRSCRSPSEKFLPPSSTVALMVLGSDRMCVPRCARSSARHTSSSVYRSKGSTLNRTEPVNSTGSYRSTTGDRQANQPMLRRN